jgi:hypothetical protein
MDKEAMKNKKDFFILLASNYKSEKHFVRRRKKSNLAGARWVFH